jgi:hypothetical protein
MIQTSTNDGIYYDINICTHKCLYCFPCNILLRCHIQRHWTNNTRPGSGREPLVAHCGDPGSSGGRSDTRMGFSATPLATLKIIPSMLKSHVSFTYHLCYTILLIKNKSEKASCIYHTVLMTFLNCCSQLNFLPGILLISLLFRHIMMFLQSHRSKWVSVAHIWPRFEPYTHTYTYTHTHISHEL